MSDASGTTQVLIYGGSRIAKAARIALMTAGIEVSVVEVHNIAISGKRADTMLLDDFDRRYLVPIEPPAPTTQRTYGPERKGRGGKIRRW